MSAHEPWVLFCDYDVQPFIRGRPCSHVWVGRGQLANEWQARLRASRDGWTCEEETSPLSGRPTLDFCPEHPNGRVR